MFAPLSCALATLQQVASDFEVFAQGDFAEPSRYHDVVSVSHGLLASITAAERACVPPAAIRSAVDGVRRLHARSPFIHRLQTWPRGYQGDFETIEYLVGQQVCAAPQTIEFWLEYMALNTPVAQQHRNKVAAQAAEVSAAVTSGRTGVRVLVLAAGSSPDLAACLPVVRDRPFSLVLNDGDVDAVAFSLARLADIRDRVRAVHSNVLTSAGRLAPDGPFDLVVAGGLFDYLPDRHASFLVRTVWDRLLAPGGRLFFTNIGRSNPFRVWMEYMADWRLIERSEADIRGLVAAACGPDTVCSIRSEGTGLTWLVRVDRPD